MTPQKYFPVFAQVRIQAPHVFAQKLLPQEIFPACIGFALLGPGAKELQSNGFCEPSWRDLPSYRPRASGSLFRPVLAQPVQGKILSYSRCTK